MKKLDRTKNSKTRPQILLHTCSPETQFITFGAAVHVEPSFIALGTCITATFSLTNISSYSTTKQSWLPRNRIEILYLSLCLCVCIKTITHFHMTQADISLSMQIALPCHSLRLHDDKSTVSCGCEESHTQVNVFHYCKPQAFSMLILEPLL